MFGYEVAERMGLKPDLKAQGYNVQEVRFVDRRGHRIGGFDAHVFRSQTRGRYVSLTRGDLAKLLYRKIERRCEVIFNDTINAIEQDERGVNVTFDRAPARRFDLVIGAGGLHSVVHRLVFDSEMRFHRFLGYAAAAFEVKGYRPRDEGVYVCYAAPRKQVARFALRDDRTVFLFVFVTDGAPQSDPADGRLLRELLRTEFNREEWECPAILAALDGCEELYFDQVSQVRMNAWSLGRVALVGDAAFCPSLISGRGPALAMLAAYVLAGELSKRKERPQEAFQRYQRFLRYFIIEKQVAAEQFAVSFVLQTPFDLFLRNQFTKASSVSLVAKLAMGESVVDRINLPEYPPD